MSIEWIKEGQNVLALIVSADHLPSETEFITPLDYKQQLGFIVYGKGETITPHLHIPMSRNLLGTSEVLVIKKGKVEVSIYRHDRTLLIKKLLTQGDIILLISGGHGFRMLEDAVMLEIKQGPYIGLEEKERFNP
jgi:hypothetical protein